ncbi:hypothetical protein AX768_16710 [Burkholderia sp. PAMC 28687]|nr:hypothetical protein AXG89_35785 [Burkholderia sp. PAMC 26561]AMM15897.1 hypothetical protein AX768_16710 [Burkholderia sp. PAMC 28687]
MREVRSFSERRPIAWSLILDVLSASGRDCLKVRRGQTVSCISYSTAGSMPRAWTPVAARISSSHILTA